MIEHAMIRLNQTFAIFHLRLSDKSGLWVYSGVMKFAASLPVDRLCRLGGGQFFFEFCFYYAGEVSDCCQVGFVLFFWNFNELNRYLKRPFFWLGSFYPFARGDGHLSPTGRLED